MSKDKTPKEVHDWINDNLISKYQIGDYIFRGENKKYEVPLSSGLYREAYEAIKKITKDNPIPMEYFSLEMVENYTVDQARRHVTGSKNIDVLTELQHYGGVTGLIDFTYNLQIALYFACDSNFKEPGCLYLFQQNEFNEEKHDIDYENKKEENILINPTSKNLRALSQSSVFVHAHYGKLTAKEDNRVEIPSAFKIGILDYINKYYNIRADTVYNDLHGFIEKQRKSDARKKMYIGTAYSHQEYYDKAIEYYDKAIKLDPKYVYAYIARASAAFRKSSFDDAIEYSTKAIELDKKSAVAYNLRGAAKASAIQVHGGNKYNYDDAIADYDEAIRLNEKYTLAYNNRGLAKGRKGDYDGAIKDYDKAIELNPEYALAYINRGSAKGRKEDYEEAINDFTKAIELNPKSIIAYHNRAYAYDKIGKTKCAEEDWKKAKELEEEQKK